MAVISVRLSVVVLNVNILSVLALNVNVLIRYCVESIYAQCIKLNVVMLNAVRLTVVAGISKIILSGCVITKVNRTFIVSL